MILRHSSGSFYKGTTLLFFSQDSVGRFVFNRFLLAVPGILDGQDGDAGNEHAGGHDEQSNKRRQSGLGSAMRS